jgi:hypothetical protein
MSDSLRHVPAVAGWYWFRHAVFHRRAGAWHEPASIVVEIIQDTYGGVALYLPVTNREWSLDDVVVAEWVGLLVPPAR